MGMNCMLGRPCWTNASIDTAPDPSVFEVKRRKLYRSATLLEVQYPNCTNFEGLKILVYKGIIDPGTHLDPHFCDDGTGPIARFEPSDEGRKLAEDFCNSLNQ
jgi:hypothetical protein